MDMPGLSQSRWKHSYAVKSHSTVAGDYPNGHAHPVFMGHTSSPRLKVGSSREAGFVKITQT